MELPAVFLFFPFRYSIIDPYMNEAETAESTHGHGCAGPSSAAIPRRFTPEGEGQHHQTSRDKVS